MNYKILPPLTWDKKFKNKSENNNFFKVIMDNFKNEDILFKVIKDNGKVKILTKSYCFKLTKKLSHKIFKSLSIKKDRNQIKIFAVLGASEESVILMLSSLFLGAHHSICFEDLSEDSIIQRIRIFKPDVVLYS